MIELRDLDPEGKAAARRFARWHLGDYMWADLILEAYLDPEATEAALDKEQTTE